MFWHLLAFIKAQRPKFFVVSHIAFHFAHNANGQIKIGTGPNTEILHFAKCQTEQPLLSFSILRVKLGSRVCGWGIFGKKWREFWILNSNHLATLLIRIQGEAEICFSKNEKI